MKTKNKKPTGREIVTAGNSTNIYAPEPEPELIVEPTPEPVPEPTPEPVPVDSVKITIKDWYNNREVRDRLKTEAVESALNGEDNLQKLMAIEMLVMNRGEFRKF